MVSINLLVKHFDPHDGYGRMGMYVLRELQACGVDVQTVLLHQAEQLNSRRLTLALIYGEYIQPRGRQWVYTMWEDTVPPPIWISALNECAERLIVPCAHNARAFMDNGVVIPVDVVPGGTDTCEFQPFDFPERPFTFMTLGHRSMRKGWDIAIRAFLEAFPAAEYPQVRLLVKAREGDFWFRFNDDRIIVQESDEPDMRRVLHQADCFVFPSLGEGWGMPPREAAAMGIPTIATRYAGLEEGIDAWCTVPLSENRVMQSIMGYGGQWVMPQAEEVAAAMRYIYERRDEAREKARQSAAWLARHQTWRHTALALKGLLERYA